MNKLKEKTKEEKRALTAFATEIYIILMLSVFLLAFGPEGYRNITEVKYYLFLVLSGIYILSMSIIIIMEKISAGRGKNTAGRVLRELSIAQWAAAGYGILTLISAFLSDYFPTALIGAERYDGALTICIYCTAFILISRYGRADKHILHSFAGAMCAFSAVCILQYLRVNIFGLFPNGLTYYDAGIKYSGEFLGTCGNAGLSAAVLAAAIPVFFTAAVKSGKKEKPLYCIALILCLAVLYSSKVIAGKLGAAAGVYFAIPFLIEGQKLRRNIIIAEAGLVLLALAALYFFDSGIEILHQLHLFLNGEADDSFGSGRLYIWRNTLPLFQEHPIFGGGPDTLKYRINVRFESLMSDGNTKIANIDTAHNEYLNILVNQGLPALVLYCTAIIAVFVRFIRGDKKEYWNTALLAGAAAYAVQAFFGISMCISTPVFWILLALGSIKENKKSRLS